MPLNETSTTAKPESQIISDDSDDDEPGFGLDDLIPEPESPTPAPYSFSTYIPPPLPSLPILDARTQLILRLVGSHPLWGHHLWNTARTLTDYLMENPQLVRGRKILELGAGAALPSIVSLLIGAEKAVMTDYPDTQLVDNMLYNVETNLPSALVERADVEGFTWGRDPGPLLDKTHGEGYDLLILSDLVFNHSQHPALIRSVNSLLRDSTSKPSPSRPDSIVPTSRKSPPLQQQQSPPLQQQQSPPLQQQQSPPLQRQQYPPEQHQQSPPEQQQSISHQRSSPEERQSPQPPPPTYPSILVFITHHRPHLISADLNFFPALASSGHGWAYQRIVERFAGVMFDEDPGDAIVRGTVYGWRCWRVRTELGELPGEVVFQ
ncbi:hypothetical protein BCR39DRAFT_509977 [Naematelia encephala]|uniref:Protein N-terminal and lysine N-methyltransferase EFM7 n=1 Tax=Naematelia encephala TaxID=71784 RepID=A0A1Y2BL41_9TREE|nr:hypothetical protein BCR39DRAFT_509977 [Naematelia encephala]